MDYRIASSSSNQFNETRDCSVKAVAIATGTEYSIVHALYKKHGRRKGCGTYRPQQEAVLKDLGFKMVDYTHQFKARTVVSLGREITNRRGNFIVYVSGHMFAVKEGSIEDWTEGRRHRIRSVELVVRVEDEQVRAPVIAPKPVQKRANVSVLIHKVANEMWSTVGRSTEVKRLLKLRRSIMDRLETMDVKRTTASSELGNWQKLILASN